MGFFNWMLEGLKRLEGRGYFNIDKKIQGEIDEYRKENNNVLVFVEEMCEVNDYFGEKCDDSITNLNDNGHVSSGSITKSELYKNYKIFCDENGYKSLGIKKFGKELKSNFFQITEGRRGATRFWENIRVLK